MNIKVLGCKDNALKRQLYKATRFFGSMIMSPQMLPYIDIEIVMRTTISDLGSCEVTYYNDWYKARQFEIQLRRHRSLKTTLITLAHEMIHVKQFAKGELNVMQTKWHGNPIDSNVILYEDLPWEEEARLLEKFLYDTYIDNASSKTKKPRYTVER